MAKGAAWTVFARLVTRSIGMVSTLILARVLVPEDFGLVAMATSLVALIELLRAFGFDTALIQNQQADRRHYDTAWTFNVVLGLLAGGLVAALAIPATWFYDEVRILPVMLVLALGIVVQGVENVGVVDFRKHLQFDRDFWFMLGQKLAGFLATVPLALYLRSYWALVIGILVTRLWAVASSYYMHPYRPRLSLAAYAELISFSKWLLLNNFLTFLRSRASDFVIGRQQGPRAVGLFNVSYEIANLPASEIVMPINRAVYSGYAIMGSDRPRLRDGFLNVISVIAAFAVPAGVGLAAVAEILVPLALGANWLDAVPIVQILSVYGVLVALQTNALYVYIAVGEPRTAALLNSLYVAILIPALILGATSAGPVGAAWACLVTALINTPLNLTILLRRLDMSAAQLFGAMWRPLPAAAIMYLVVTNFLGKEGTTAGTASGLPSMAIDLVMAVGLGAICYGAALIFLWVLSGRPNGIEAQILRRIQSLGGINVGR